MVPLLFGFSALRAPAHAMADEGFLECVGSSANAPQPSPSTSEVPQPSPSDSPQPVASPSPVASEPAPAGSVTALDVTASPSPGPSSAAPELYGVFIKPERLNQGMLSADIFLLTPHGGWIKQVGHADLDAPASSGPQEGDFSAARTYQSDSSSPFPFQLTLSDGQASLVQATLFSGSSLSILTLDCRGARHGR